VWSCTVRYSVEGIPPPASREVYVRASVFAEVWVLLYIPEHLSQAYLYKSLPVAGDGA